MHNGDRPVSRNGEHDNTRTLMQATDRTLVRCVGGSSCLTQTAIYTTSLLTAIYLNFD